MKRIVITGANGLIGSHVAEYFCARGLRPACLVRDTRRADFLRTLPVEISVADVTRPDDLARAFHHGDTIIHTAARVSEWGRYEEFHLVNVDGTVNVMNAAAEAGAAHVIITGSNSCYGEEDSTEVKTEESPYKPHYPYFLHRLLPSGLNHYRDTKALANTLAEEIARLLDLPLTIIEPVWVYGEREFHSGFYDYLRTLRSGLPFFPGSASNRFHTIYAGDLARLYFRVAEAGLPDVQRFIACDRTPVSMRELLATFCGEAGIRPPRLLPKWLVYPPALLMEAAALAVRAKRPPMLTRAVANTFYDNIEYSGEKARLLLDFVPTTPWPESIRRTVAWYRERGLL